MVKRVASGNSMLVEGAFDRGQKQSFVNRFGQEVVTGRNSSPRSEQVFSD
jgi:hypothetical protein